MRTGFVALAVVMVSVLAGCAAGGSSDESSAVAQEREVALQKASDELASILQDLTDENALFHETVSSYASITGRDPNEGIHNFVEYAEYEHLSKRLRAWRRTNRIEHPAFWDELVGLALTMSDDMAKSASAGGDEKVHRAIDAEEGLNATLDAHCQGLYGSSLVQSCE